MPRKVSSFPTSSAYCSRVALTAFHFVPGVIFSACVLKSWLDSMVVSSACVLANWLDSAVVFSACVLASWLSSSPRGVRSTQGFSRY